MYRFYFEDTLETVSWVDNPQNTFGPWNTATEAIKAFHQTGFGSDPADACYILMTENQSKSLRDKFPTWDN